MPSSSPFRSPASESNPLRNAKRAGSHKTSWLCSCEVYRCAGCRRMSSFVVRYGHEVTIFGRGPMSRRAVNAKLPKSCTSAEYFDRTPSTYRTEADSGCAILRSTSLQAHRYSGPHSQQSRSCELATILCAASSLSRTHRSLTRTSAGSFSSGT